MAKSREGGCQCGAIRYAIDGVPLTLAVCHCRDCQRQSGSAFGMSLVVRRDDFHLLAGEPRVFTRSADSGNEVACAFCPDCGVRLYHQPSKLTKTVNVKPGTLDDTSGLEPAMHVWARRKQAWSPIPAGIPQFPQNPSKPGR